MRFADIAHYFEWCRLLEKFWRARVARSPKGKRAEASLRKFHKANPGEPEMSALALRRITKERHVINLAAERIGRERRRAMARAVEIREGSFTARNRTFQTIEASRPAGYVEEASIAPVIERNSS